MLLHWRNSALSAGPKPVTAKKTKPASLPFARQNRGPAQLEKQKTHAIVVFGLFPLSLPYARASPVFSASANKGYAAF
jgi:hypothetical protein